MGVDERRRVGPLIRMMAPLVATALMVSGCGRLVNDGGGQAEDPCAWLGNPVGAGEDVTSEAVVMLDLSSSMWVSESGRLPDHSRTVGEEMLVDFEADGERSVTLGIFTGDKSAIYFPISTAGLPAPLYQGQEEQRKRLLGCVHDVVQEVLAEPPREEGTDVLAAIDRGAQVFAGDGMRRLTVVTDGQNNVGCLDLNRVLPEPDYDAVVADCAEEREWPQGDLSGVELGLVGVSGAGVESTGDLSGSQAVGRITEFWNAIGARLTGAGTGAEGGFVSGAAPERTEAPGTEFPPDPPILVIDNDVLVIDTGALFATDSAELLPEARESIDAFLRAHGDTLDQNLGVTVTGHTDSRGSDAHNADLSTRRAESVRNHLVAAGFSEVEAEGRGSAEPVCDDMPDGSFDDDCGQKNRRVEIQFNQE